MATDSLTRRWHGLGASPGLVTGLAQIIRSERDLAETRPEAILVARHATPALFPSLVRARAAVCETGGRLSHLAVLARELGKPCVTGLPGIIDAVAPGTILRVDGATGTVDIVSDAPAGAERPAQPTPPDAGPPSSPTMRPVLQFGAFTPTFERTGAPFDVETAIRLAALVTLPLAAGEARPWPFAIVGHQVHVAEALLTATVTRLAGTLADGALATALRQDYQRWCDWPGWVAEMPAGPAADWLLTALRAYVRLNQVTWLAVLVREPLTERYRSWLETRLA
jgi:phosphohistidine swiveling domain-containing protein